MLAIEIKSPGAADVLVACERPLPQPQPQQVLIRVLATGVNRPDVMQRLGLYPPPPGASDIPGLEVAGEIIALGEQVQGLAVGDACCALLTGGGYAEYCLANASLCLPIPQGLSMIAAASLPETFFTVWSTVFQRAALQAGETLLVHGGSSGIGTTAIQLAKAFAAKVFVTAGSQQKCDFCLALGADAAINYRDHDFVTAIQDLTQGEGVNVILDMIGGSYLPRNIKCLATDGRLVQIALQESVKAEINLLPLMLKRLTLTGATLRPRPDAFKAQIARQLQQQVWPLIANGQIKPVIDSVFDLADAAKAHQRMESSQHQGKIVLRVAPC